MVQHQLIDRKIYDKEVLNAFGKVPRELFIMKGMEEATYDDCPLPIGYGQTISQPYIVAYMLESLRLKGNHSVLEIGTGCGYQTAILAEICKKVYTIEIIKPLLEVARKNLTKAGYNNVVFKSGDGNEGWKERGPFDRIIVSASAHRIPPALLDQLAIGGKMILPVGKTVWGQSLKLVEKLGKGRFQETKSLGVRFVPLVGSEI